MGDFDILEGVDLAGDVRSLKQRLKAWSADLAGIEPRHMTVFGPWGAKPTVASWKAKLADGDAAVDPAAAISTLIVDMECAYFIVSITAPPPAAAAAGAGA